MTNLKVEGLFCNIHFEPFHHPQKIQPLAPSISPIQFIQQKLYLRSKTQMPNHTQMLHLRIMSNLPASIHTTDMRTDALKPADLDRWVLTVVDVGCGTRFTTLGIVERVDANRVTILDQSPHQLAKVKEALKECRIIDGDAVDLPPVVARVSPTTASFVNFTVSEILATISGAESIEKRLQTGICISEAFPAMFRRMKVIGEWSSDRKHGYDVKHYSDDYCGVNE